MIDVLLIFHLLGLMLGVTGGLGGAVVLATATPAQKQKGGPIRGIGPVFTRMSIAGLVLLWPSGVALLLTTPEGAALNVMFWMKMGFVALVTFATASSEMVYAQARRGQPKVAQLLLSLGPLATLAYTLAVVFSVLAFH